MIIILFYRTGDENAEKALFRFYEKEILRNYIFVSLIVEFIDWFQSVKKAPYLSKIQNPENVGESKPCVFIWGGSPLFDFFYSYKSNS